MRRRSRKLGDPTRRGIDGERLLFERGADAFDDADEEDDDDDDDEEDEPELEESEESDDWSESESDEESAELSDEELDDEEDETEWRLLFLTLGFLSWSMKDSSLSKSACISIDSLLADSFLEVSLGRDSCGGGGGGSDGVSCCSTPSLVLSFLL